MDVKVPLRGKSVVVTMPDGMSRKEAFNEAASFVRTLEANKQLRDREAGIDPPGATHQIVKERGQYHLRRFRFSAF